MEKISRRKFWLLLILLSGAASVLLGKNWLFINARCSQLQELLLYVCAGVGTLIVLIYVMTTYNDSLISKIISIAGLLAGVLVIASIIGTVLAGVPQVQSVYCPLPCDMETSPAASFLNAGKLDAAEQAARDCIEKTSNTEILTSCTGSCADVLAWTLYEKAGKAIDTIPTLTKKDKVALCGSAQANLDEALSLVNQYKLDNLTVSSIKDRARVLTTECAPPTIPPTPTPMVNVEVMRKQVGAQEVLLDVRPLKNNEFQDDLQISDFSLKADDGAPIDFGLEQRNADDSVCMVVVADNSGSIYPGLQSIRAAITKLNDFRKPGDQFGLITFASRDQVILWQLPASEPLDPEKIDGTGRLTALWDGIDLGLTTLQSCQAKNRNLLVLTDGIDNDSRYMAGDSPIDIANSLVSKASQQNVDICVVGVTNNVDAGVLGKVVRGCGYFYAEDFDGIATQFQNIFGYVYDFYRLTFLIEKLPANKKVILQVPGSGEVTIDFANP